MIMSIINYVGEINRFFLAGVCFSMFVLFLWNKVLVKRIFKWAFTLTTVTAAVLMVQMLLNDSSTLPWDKQLQEQEERKPLVTSSYYRDPMESAQKKAGK